MVIAALPHTSNLRQMAAQLKRSYRWQQYGLAGAIRTGEITERKGSLILHPKGARYFDCVTSTSEASRVLSENGIANKRYSVVLPQDNDSLMRHWFLTALDRNQLYIVGFTPFDEMMGINPIENMGSLPTGSNPLSYPTELSHPRVRSTVAIGGSGMMSFSPFRARRISSNDWIMTSGGIKIKQMASKTFIFFIRLQSMSFSSDEKALVTSSVFDIAIAERASRLKALSRAISELDMGYHQALDKLGVVETKSESGDYLEGYAAQDWGILTDLINKTPV